MGRKLDALLGRNLKTSKLKTTLKLAISRLSLLKNQRRARHTIAHSDVVQLLHLNHHEHALLRVEQVIKDQNMLDVYDTIHGYCHLLVQRINLIEHVKECPDELEEAASNLLYAAPRCGEFPELQEIRAILTTCFGKEFAYSAIELRNNSRVTQEMVEKLSSGQSKLQSRMKMLMEIAMENGIVLKLDEPSHDIQKDKLVVEKKQAVAAAEIEQVLSFSESMKGRKTYRDVTDAAHAAFEAAAYAAAAARAAVVLSRSESFDSDGQDSPNSRPRKVLNSEPIKSKLHISDHKSYSSPKYDSEYEYEGERSNHNMKAAEFDDSDSDSDSYSNSAKDYDNSEGRNRNAYFSSYKQFPFRHQANLKAESGPGNAEPISVRNKRVYGR